MPKQISIMLADSVWAAAQAIPKDQRQALFADAIADAVQKTPSLEVRLAAAMEMDRLRSTIKPVDGCSEDWIREERDCCYPQRSSE